MEWCVVVSVPPEVNNHLLRFADIEDQVVGAVLLYQVFHFTPVGVLVVIRNEAHHCRVFRIL